MLRDFLPKEFGLNEPRIPYGTVGIDAKDTFALALRSRSVSDRRSKGRKKKKISNFILAREYE
ncbi:hypothetical protein DSM107003_17070 [Trichormus variabilis SAG 1403-4b]|uniref:Uncharacterized protein n=1 Tax=Trichormus variabilis SAG 1403-4b TaxID=447716 RepID=A0A3S1C7B6_ANAVA|nr:hypothetical protein DSM107003_17070 [Trichormus variabilis SAG 1403-4b]